MNFRALVFTCGIAAMAAPSLSLAQTSTITNFHQVDDAVFRSGKPTAEQFAELAPVGIRTVLSLESYMMDPDDADEEQAAAEAQGIRFLRIPMTPLPFDRPSLDDLRAALALTLDPANQPILVHCRQGSDRTGLVIGAYHIKAHGWSADAAIADMRNFGHNPLFYWWDDMLYDIE